MISEHVRHLLPCNAASSSAFATIARQYSTAQLRTARFLHHSKALDCATHTHRTKPGLRIYACRQCRSAADCMAGGGWRLVAKSWLQLTGGVAALLAADHVCQAACAAAGIRFPPALIGDQPSTVPIQHT